MDRNIRQMMKLIEDNGDSFAQKAEMYYQKRPELISLVEEFYRGYRSLAERYEHVTGELWKNIPSDLQSHSSFVSDNGSEHPPSLPSASPRKTGRRISSNRAAGFDFFLGSGGNNYDAISQKDGDASSTLTDSDDEFDDASSINSYSGFFGNSSDHGMTKRVIELEIDLREVKEKLLFYEQQEHGEDFGDKINAYEQELKNVNENLRHSE
ncbi:golgin subfamily A member 3-like, partial [Trifolium medium]|nr:golgin subfamily A member 3-like [Trifolium medium]